MSADADTEYGQAFAAFEVARAGAATAVQKLTDNSAAEHRFDSAASAIEQADARSRRDRALGKLDAAGPTQAEIDNVPRLRRDAQACRDIAPELKKRAENAAAVEANAQRALYAAKRDMIDRLHAGHLAEYGAAWDQVRVAGEKLMAASRLKEHVYADPSRNKFGSRPLYDLYGPVASIFQELRLNVNWQEYHQYSVRPTWIPRHGDWYSIDLPGISVEEERIKAELGIEDLA